MAVFADIKIDFSTKFSYNEARVTRQGGATVVAQSAAPGSVGVRSKTLTVETETDAQAATIASRILTLYGSPTRRVVSLESNPWSSAAIAAAVLTDVLGSRVRTTFTPVGGGTA